MYAMSPVVMNIFPLPTVFLFTFPLSLLVLWRSKNYSFNAHAFNVASIFLHSKCRHFCTLVHQVHWLLKFSVYQYCSRVIISIAYNGVVLTTFFLFYFYFFYYFCWCWLHFWKVLLVGFFLFLLLSL